MIEEVDLKMHGCKGNFNQKSQEFVAFFKNLSKVDRWSGQMQGFENSKVTLAYLVECWCGYEGITYEFRWQRLTKSAS